MTEEGSELDEIMSEANLPTTDPAPQITEETTTPATPAQPRDESGRFAANQAQQPEPEPAMTEQASQPEGKPGTVPQAALHAARESQRQERERADRLERELAELRGTVNAVLQQRQTPPAPPSAPEAPPAPWDEGYSDWVKEQAIRPMRQEMQRQRMETSRMLADTQFGVDVVKAADDALGELARINPEAAKEVGTRVAASPFPYIELVQWHKRETAIKTVGGDPEAWFKQRLDAVLADPAQQAAILEKIRGSAASKPNGQAPVTEVPPSLSRLPGGGTAAPGGLSDEALFSQAFAAR